MHPKPDQPGATQEPDPKPPRSESPEPAIRQEHQKLSEGEERKRGGALQPSASLRWVKAALWDSWHFDKEPSIFDSITTCVSIVGLILLLWQLNQTEAALNEAREANRLTREAQAAADVESLERTKRDERMVAATEASSKAAMSAVDAQRDALRQEQRAFVVAGTQRVIQEPTTERQTLSVEMPWSNVGRTSGRNVTTQAGLLFGRGTGPANVKNRTYTSSESVSAIHPGVPLHSVVNLEFSEQELKAYRERQASIIVFARLEYDDMFGGRHWVACCVYRDFGDERFRFCQTANDFGTVGETR